MRARAGDLGTTSAASTSGRSTSARRSPRPRAVRFDAVVEATEEVILNALYAAEPTTGFRGAVAHELPLDRLRKIPAARAAP